MSEGNLRRALAERALDVVLYAPVGALSAVVDELPELASEGRARVGREIRNAAVIGRVAVAQAQRVVQRQIGRLGSDRAPGTPSAAPRHEPTPGPVANREPGAASGGGGAVPGGGVAAGTTSGTAGSVSDNPSQGSWERPEVDAAIPGYDNLSASQVVRRLEGLGSDELALVVAYESGHRGRRTVLNRAHQLLEGTGPAADPPDGGN